VRAQRAVLARVVHYLVADAGVRQLLDIGSGLPTAQNVHQIAQRIDPAARVIYVDNDPVVLAHARALLADDTVTFAAQGDLRDPAGILASPEVRTRLDWDQPVGLLLCGILHYLLDEEQPAYLVKVLCDALPAGSYVFIQHLLHRADRHRPRWKPPCSAGWAGRSSAHWSRYASCSAGSSSSSRGWCPSRTGAPMEAPEPCAIIRSWAWHALA
jgi:S-adenosyl methyltransferase